MNIMREGRKAVRKSIDESLTKLKTDYIDLLLIHWPVKDCVKDTWQVMEDYVRQGKVKFIGVSNFNRHHLDDLLSYAEIRPVISLGYRAGEPNRPERRPLDDIAKFY